MMDDTQFEMCYSIASATNDKNAYLSDMALSSLWGDVDGDDLPQDRLDELSRIWDVAHMSMRDIRKSCDMTQNEFAKKFLIPKRTIENWEGDKSIPPVYVKLLIAKALNLY